MVWLVGIALLLAAPALSAYRLTRAQTDWKASLLFLSWAAGAILLKSALALGLMSPSLRPGVFAWLWCGCGVACALALLLVLPRRAAAFLAFGAVVAVSGLLWIDVLYYRVFGDFLSAGLLAGLHQLPSVQDSVWQLVRATDLLFFLDLPLALPALLAGSESAAASPRVRLFSAALPASIFLAGNALWYVQADPMSTNFMRNRLYNWSHVQRSGLLPYHLYDLYHLARPRFDPPEPLPDDIIRHRLSLSSQTVGSMFPHYAKAAGANVLMIQLESFQSFLVDLKIEGQEVTPFFNRLKQESLYGAALDQTSHGSSSDAEFVMLNSLQPPGRGPLCFLFSGQDYRALPTLLAERGYRTLKLMPYDGAYWNARIMSERFGFAESYFVESFRPPRRGEWVGWGLSDAALYEQMVPFLKQQKEPFFCYVTTLMMHYPFRELRSHQETLKLPPRLRDTMLGSYLQLARFRDRSLELLVTRMKEEGLWENTVLVLAGDHRSRMEEAEISLLEVPEPRPLRHRVPLLIHLPGGKAKGELPRSVGQIDLAPTLLHLLGESPQGAVFLGRNALAGGHATVSCWGFITDEEVALWGGSDPKDNKLYKLPGNELLEDEPRAEELYRQLDEELRASDTLIFGNRIPEFAEISSQQKTDSPSEGASATPKARSDR